MSTGSGLESMLTPGPLRPSPNRGSPVKRAVAGVVATAFVGFAVVAALMVRAAGEVPDYPGPGAGTATVIVQRGDSLGRIAEKLQAADVVLSTEAFLNAADAEPRATGIAPGRYELLAQMTGSGALQRMLDPASRADSRLVLPEGLRLAQTVDAAAKATRLPIADFEESLAASADLGLPVWAKGRPEGFMFPATYDLTGQEDAAQVLEMLVTRFKQASSEIGLESEAAKVGLDPYQVLIVASLLQAEVAPADFPKAARVIYNRLADDMPLQLDSTVSYALGITDLQLNADQLATESPYNTYANKGLPPTPINSPGESALAAALNPADGKWLYFVTVNPSTKETKFTRSYDKFLAYKDELKQYLAANG